MTLNTLWFILVGVLYTGFFVLEGFDFGVGMLMPFLSRDKNPEKVDTRRRVILNTIGPHWDSNEVWLIVAGGATFAAFPHWYATLFSGFYLALLLLLLALIIRGVAFEFRSKDENPVWRKIWDWCIFIGSLLPPLLLGVAFANMIRGVPIDAQMNFTGNLLTLLNPYALLGGVVTVAGFVLLGAIFLSLKTAGTVLERAKSLAKKLWPYVAVLMMAYLILTYFVTDMDTRLGAWSLLVPLLGIGALVGSDVFMRRKASGKAFLMAILSVVLTAASLFMILYPRLMISSTDLAYSLTITNASSSPYTLRVMTIVAAIFTPIIVFYQAWSYRVFRKRVSSDPQKLTY